jgi:hypothetical protein
VEGYMDGEREQSEIMTMKRPAKKPAKKKKAKKRARQARK